ncbi:glycosyl transferase family protein [Planococcus sp. PAMC 21323]|uniref:glycosyltransferase family 4 protein n=1 Tax=Planococcus sp. PAMC 21323 TaxID=1526927 RepID=UPI00056F2E9E|nr:glycosyltransferase family 4 protein [Planococcus sp. PAMC 21323]AIY06223.1 glycosyl transferase family protein [Planococcus sp. PAMC 21323]
MLRKRKITFVINYFYPDLAATSQLMTELTKYLQRDFIITVIAAQPGYAGENHDSKKLFEEAYVENIKVVRIKLPEVNKNSKISRIKYISSYFLFANIALLKEKGTDVIFTISQPPVLGGLIGTIGKLLKRSRHVYSIHDFNPEQAQAVAYTNNQAVFKIAKVIDKINCSYADQVLVVGEDMAETLKGRFEGGKVPDHTIISNWTDEEAIVPLENNEPEIRGFLETHGLQDKFIVMYSGNLGLYYDLENLIQVSKEFVDQSDIVFLFIGEGAVKQRIQTYAIENKLENVKFLPYQPKEFLKYSLNAADVHLVVNQKGIKGVSVPSKIYGVMAAGKPVLGVLEEGSEVQRLIFESGAGIVVEPQDYQGVIQAIQYLYSLDAGDLKTMGLKGRAYLEKNLTRDTSINKYRQVLQRVADRSQPGSVQRVKQYERVIHKNK